jgi:tRNA (guanine-N7-)-methyltransferase
LKFAVGEARELLERYVEPGSVAEIHCYHPQPYYDPSKVHRRLITPSFLELVHRSLVPGGLFVLQTDNPGYWRYMQAIVPVFFDFAEQKGHWPDSPKGRTRREIIAQRRGLPIFRGVGKSKIGLSETEAIALADQMPPPVFDADLRYREADLLDIG